MELQAQAEMTQVVKNHILDTKATASNENCLGTKRCKSNLV
jgi:hypothetical protein